MIEVSIKELAKELDLSYTRTRFIVLRLLENNFINTYKRRIKGHRGHMVYSMTEEIFKKLKDGDRIVYSKNVSITLSTLDKKLDRILEMLGQW